MRQICQLSVTGLSAIRSIWCSLLQPCGPIYRRKTTEIPILGTAITDYEVARLVDSNEAPGGNVSGTTDMNPIKEQIDLLDATGS